MIQEVYHANACSSPRVASIVDEGIREARLEPRFVFYNTIYSLVTLVDGIDILTIFTVTSSDEDFLWARHAIFFMTSQKNGCAGSLRGGSRVCSRDAIRSRSRKTGRANLEKFAVCSASKQCSSDKTKH